MKHNDQIIAQHLTLEKEDCGHSRNKLEICYIKEGSEIIFSSDKEHFVAKGDLCQIPPLTNQWMNPNSYLKLLLIYSNND